MQQSVNQLRADAGVPGKSRFTAMSIAGVAEQCSDVIFVHARSVYTFLWKCKLGGVIYECVADRVSALSGTDAGLTSVNDMSTPVARDDEPPSSAALTTYDIARQAIATCVVIDDAKDIKDRAEALRQYALQKNDPERAEWLGQIACRAAIRIGEISGELEKVETAGPSTVRLPADGKPKRQTLADAGISTSAAGRYEMMAKKSELLDQYFDACRATGRAPSAGGFQKFDDREPEESVRAAAKDADISEDPAPLDAVRQASEPEQQDWQETQPSQQTLSAAWDQASKQERVELLEAIRVEHHMREHHVALINVAYRAGVLQLVEKNCGPEWIDELREIAAARVIDNQMSWEDALELVKEHGFGQAVDAFGRVCREHSDWRREQEAAAPVEPEPKPKVTKRRRSRS
jgi:hypothetical protein